MVIFLLKISILISKRREVIENKYYNIHSPFSKIVYTKEWCFLVYKIFCPEIPDTPIVISYHHFTVSSFPLKSVYIPYFCSSSSFGLYSTCESSKNSNRKTTTFREFFLRAKVTTNKPLPSFHQFNFSMMFPKQHSVAVKFNDPITPSLSQPSDDGDVNLWHKTRHIYKDHRTLTWWVGYSQLGGVDVNTGTENA